MRASEPGDGRRCAGLASGERIAIGGQLTARSAWAEPRWTGGRATAWLAAALLLAATSAATAHRGHAVWTDISWNGAAFEITHRLHLADAVSIARSLGSREPIGSPRSLARLALYAEERFAIPIRDTAAELATIGAEIEDDFLFVYQEWSTPLPSRFPAVDNRLLIDVEPQAQQFIRISGPGIEEERQSVDEESSRHIGYGS